MFPGGVHYAQGPNGRSNEGRAQSLGGIPIDYYIRTS